MNCGEIVVVGRYLSFECGCGPHSAVWPTHHTTVGVVLKPNYYARKLPTQHQINSYFAKMICKFLKNLIRHYACRWHAVVT